MDAYAATVGPTRAFVSPWDGTQPGDPAKAARAIVDVVSDSAPPLRLPLGADAVDAIEQKLSAVAADVKRIAPIAKATAFAGRQ